MNNNPFSIVGKTILVTGASSGIGRGICVECSHLGAIIHLAARNENRLEESLGLMEPGNHVSHIADLALSDDIDRLVNEVPVLDGIVLCAGIIKTMPVRNISEFAMEEIFNANIFGSIKLCSKLLKKKKIANGGSVVFISSVSTFNVKIGNSLYSATKGAVNSFAKTMALEVANQKIRVNCIQPGFVQTNLIRNHGFGEDVITWYAERHPLGLGTPLDIANGCIYLLSDASRWVTGSVITMDGGYTLQ